MRFNDTFFSRDERFSIGIDLETDGCYVSIPVSNGLVDYEEYYEIDRETYARFLSDPAVASSFAAECRRRDRDELLIIRPGRNRGTPV
ncbi:hypothetical protein [Rhodococcus oryzae]|jgi:hypothetical protein|uniref:hypothetical protein n=1 Tax=Rhodococcus oryzae TaxID=2571143 RepID=UPI0037BA506D